MPLPCNTALRIEVIKELDALPTLDNVERALVFAMVASLMIATTAAWYVVSRPARLHSYDPDEYAPRFRGLKGGLLFVALLTLIEPIRVLFVSRCNLFLFSSEMWSLLVDLRWPMGTEWGSTLLLWNATVPAAQFVFAAALPVALLLRRRSFRMLAVWYLVGVMVALLVEGFILTQVFGNLSEIVSEQFRTQNQWLAITIVAGAYLLVSRRVHSTARK